MSGDTEQVRDNTISNTLPEPRGKVCKRVQAQACMDTGVQAQATAEHWPGRAGPSVQGEAKN